MKQLLTTLLLLFAVSLPGFAQAVVKYQGLASQGNVQVSSGGVGSTNKVLGSYTAATVSVYLTGTLTLATLYSDSSLTPKSNPFTVTSEGYYEFYITPGTYDLRFSGTGITVPFTRSAVDIGLARAAQIEYYTIAARPTCTASLRGRQIQLTDSSKELQTCVNTTGSTYDWVNVNGRYRVQAFGGKTGVTATVATAAINAALSAINTAGGGVLDISDVSLSVNAAIPLYNNVRITGNGTITQTTNNTSIFTITNKSNIIIEGLNFVGVGTDYQEVISDPAQAINATGVVAGLIVDKCTFTNFANAAVKVKGSNVKLTNLTIVGVGLAELTPVTSGACYGIAIESTTDDVYIAGCSISETAQGIASGQNVTNLKVTSCTMKNIRGQHGIYLGGGGNKNISITNVTVENARLIGIKVQVDDAAALDVENVTITGCTVLGADGGGIAVTSGVANGTYKIRNATINGNTIRDDAPDDAISLQDVVGGAAVNNTIEDTDRDGISCINCQSFIIAQNNIRGVAQNGIKLNVISGGTSTNNSVTSNKILNPATSNTVSAEFGIHLRGSSYTFVSRNEIRDANANMQYGIFCETGDQTTSTYEYNLVLGATDNGIRYKSGEAALINRGNYVSNAPLNLPTTNQRGDWGRIFYSTAVPSTGTWEVGDVVWNYTPTLNGIIAWICTTAGTPGTWTILYSHGTTATPTFAGLTLSAATANLLDVVSSASGDNTLAKFRATDSGGYASIQIDRPSTARAATVKFATATVNDWFLGMAYNGGSANSDFTLGTSINLSDHKFKFSSGGVFSYTGLLAASGTPQTLTGAGAVNLTTAITYLVTTGANALTLADGVQGQIKTIRMKTDGGDGTLTPTNAEGFTTVTFNDVGDTVTLQFMDGKWNVVGYFGVTIA